MKPCPQVEEDLPLLASGDLEPNAARRVLDHLEGCPQCRARWEHLSDVCRSLAATAAAAPQPALSDDFEARLVTRLNAEAATVPRPEPTRAPVETRRDREVTPWPRWLFWFAAVASAAMAVFMVVIVMKTGRDPGSGVHVASVDRGAAPEMPRFAIPRQAPPATWSRYREALEDSSDALDSALRNEALGAEPLGTVWGATGAP